MKNEKDKLFVREICVWWFQNKITKQYNIWKKNEKRVVITGLGIVPNGVG
jgi:hypothetical protein